MSPPPFALAVVGALRAAHLCAFFTCPHLHGAGVASATASGKARVTKTARASNNGGEVLMAGGEELARGGAWGYGAYSTCGYGTGGDGCDGERVGMGQRRMGGDEGCSHEEQ